MVAGYFWIRFISNVNTRNNRAVPQSIFLWYQQVLIRQHWISKAAGHISSKRIVTLTSRNLFRGGLDIFPVNS